MTGRKDVCKSDWGRSTDVNENLRDAARRNSMWATSVIDYALVHVGRVHLVVLVVVYVIVDSLKKVEGVEGSGGGDTDSRDIDRRNRLSKLDGCQKTDMLLDGPSGEGRWKANDAARLPLGTSTSDLA